MLQEVEGLWLFFSRKRSINRNYRLDEVQYFNGIHVHDKCLDACLPSALRACGSSRAALEDQREPGAVQSVISAFRVGGC